MSTVTGSKMTTTRPGEKKRSSAGRAAQSVGRVLLLIIGSLIVTIAMLPVILLPLTTSVPWYLSLIHI